MKMKAKNIVLSFLGSAALVCLSLGVGLSVGNPVEAQAAEQTTIFECPGASIRMNKQDGLNGIRFPMFMDDTTFNTLTSNATIQSEDVTFGTLIIPTDKLTGTLDVNTALAKNLVTYGYNEKDEFVNVWTECTDEDYPDCMQGYAYIHSIPDTSLDRNLTAVGYYTVDGGASYVYTQPIERHVSYVADAAIKSGDYSEAQMTKLEDFLANYTLTFDVDSEITTQQVKYGKTFNFPMAAMETPAGSTLDWYEVDSGAKVVSNGTLTASKSATYKLQAVENVQYTTTIYNKENIFKGDPSVTYRDGYYYSIYEDSKSRLWILKTASLEEILEGGSSGWGHSGKAVCVYEPKEGDELGAAVWAPELTYIQGKWYIYVCGVAYGQTRQDTNMKMFVMECKSQDPTGEWNAPIRLYPNGFDNYYAIDGHAFEYKNQLYYVYSGHKESWWGGDSKAHLYIVKMSNPTTLTNDTPVKISKGSDLEEGPCTIVDGEDVYLVYSAGTWNGADYNNENDYHLEYYKLTGTNLLSSYSWTAKGTCLEHDASKDIYAVGHNHIFKNADGSLWTSYHGVVGTEGVGTDEYLSKRRTMVQPISIVNGELNFGGIQATVVITDKAGLQYNNLDKTEYVVDGYGSARLWENDGNNFTVSTTITRVSGSEQFCAGITLYERNGDGNLNKLLIGVEKEGNIFFCKDYYRFPLYYKYEGWLWNNNGVANLEVSYTAGESTADSTITIVVANKNYTESLTRTYTLDELNALVSDKVDGETKAFDLHFTGDFEIGLGGNLNRCTFTNVLFDNSRSVTFVDAYGNKTIEKYADGATLELPAVVERQGFEFLGWAERIGEDSYTAPGEITDMTVTSDREFVAKFNPVGPTYEKPALVTENALISEAEYSFVQYGRDEDYPTSYSIESSAALFEDVGISNWKEINGSNANTKFVVAGTVKGGWTSIYTGFVFSTQDGHYLQLVIDKENGIMLQSQSDVWQNASGANYGVWRNYLSKADTDKLFDYDSDTRIAVEFDGDRNFIVYINGTKATTINLRYSNQGDSSDRRHYLAWGTGDTLRLGLNATNGYAIFTDWGYTTDESAFNEYIFPSNDDWTPVFKNAGAYCEEGDGEVTIRNGGYLLEGAEVANWNNGNAGNVSASGDNWVNGGKQMNTKFSISATIKAKEEENYKVGFIFTLNGADYFTVVYNNEEKEIRVQASNGHYRDYGLGDTFDPAGTTMTLEYDGIQGLILYFGEGENKKVADLKNAWSLTAGPGIIFRYGYSKAADGGFGDNEHITTALKESNGTLKVGLVAMDGTATFTDWSFWSEPAYLLGTELYTGATMTMSNDVLTYKNLAGIGAQVFEGVEIEQGTDFVIYAKVASGMTAQNVGFVVGTLGADNTNHLLFQWRRLKNDFYIWKDLGGWAGHNDGVFDSSIGTSGAEIALVYKDGTYYAFLNGEQVCYFKDTFDNGWGKLMNVNDFIGTDGTLKIGLSVAYGTAQFTEWGYSTDTSVIEEYVPGKTLTNSYYYLEGAEVANWNNGNKGNVSSDGTNWVNGGKQMNTKFSISATIKANADEKYKAGFIFTLNGTDYFMVVYNNEEKEIRVQASDGKYRDYGLGDTFDSAGTTMTIEYDGIQGLYIYFGEGANKKLVDLKNAWTLSAGPAIIFRYGYTPAADGGSGNNEHITTALKESSGTLKVGLVVMDGAATFMDYTFTTIIEEGKTLTNSYYYIEGAEVANWNNGNKGNVSSDGTNWVNGGKQMNTKFSVSATIKANANENYKVGFIFTLNGTDYFTVVYNNEEKQIRVQASDGHYRDYGLGNTFDPAGTTMTIEYDGVQGLYIYFGEGGNKKLVDLKNAWTLSKGAAIIFRYGYTGDAADGGAGDNEHITVALRESSGTLKVGLVAMDGTATFTDYSFELQ